MLRVLNIDKKCKPDLIGTASPHDFEWSTGGRVDPDILNAPYVTLYCLDDKRGRAVLVETKPDVDVTESTFLYQGQYQHAERLLVLRYNALADVPVTQGEQPILFIHSTGRCGSTVVSEAFRELGFVRVLAEPDFFTNVAHLRMRSARSDLELEALLRGGGELLLRPLRESGVTMAVVKLRSSCIEIVDLLARAFPSAKQMFMFRDLRPWIVSSARAFPSFQRDVPPDMWRQGLSLFAREVPLLRRHLREFDEYLSVAEVLALQWLSIVHRYVEGRRSIPMLRLRYEDLLNQPAQALHATFSHAGLPEATVSSGLRAFGRDSQEGTVLSREAVRERAGVHFSEEEWERVRSITRMYGLSSDDADALPDIVESMAI